MPDVPCYGHLFMEDVLSQVTKQLCSSRSVAAFFGCRLLTNQLLMPLIAFPSNDTTRTALLKLLEAIVVTQSTEAKLQILKEVSYEPPSEAKS